MLDNSSGAVLNHSAIIFLRTLKILKNVLKIFIIGRLFLFLQHTEHCSNIIRTAQIAFSETRR